MRVISFVTQKGDSRLRRTQNKAVERLHALQAHQHEIEETLLGVSGQVLQHAGADEDDRDLGRRIRRLIAEPGVSRYS